MNDHEILAAYDFNPEIPCGLTHGCPNHATLLVLAVKCNCPIGPACKECYDKKLTRFNWPWVCDHCGIWGGTWRQSHRVVNLVSL